jgi:hypothetical protein
MRFWRTADGGILIERTQGRFVVIGHDGTIVDVLDPWGSSDSDTMYRMSYGVQGSGLVQYTDVEPDRGGDYRYCSAVKLTGLVEMPATECWLPLHDLDVSVARFKEERHRQ